MADRFHAAFERPLEQRTGAGRDGRARLEAASRLERQVEPQPRALVVAHIEHDLPCGECQRWTRLFGGTADQQADRCRVEIEVSGEVFTAAVMDSVQARLLSERLASGARGVVSGDLLPGDGGFNGGWGWHWDPESVHVADMAIELCDGRPSMVQADLPYWIGTVQQYCPWGAKVVARTQ